MILRDVIEGEEFLSLSSEQMVRLIASEELTAQSEEKVCNLKLMIIIIFQYPLWIGNLSNPRT